MPSKSVQCVVTSPPYWGLRDYGVDGQLGLEKTPDEYIKNLVEVFREVKRVLRDDGTLWLNIADSYASEPFEPWGIKPKDEVDVSARTAQALQKDGWWKRCTIIWSKPNPMPESVTDRPTKSHEYIFLLTKNAHYFYDQEAIREPILNPGQPRRFAKRENGDRNDSDEIYEPSGRSGRNIRTVWEITTQPYPEAHFATFPEELPKRCIKAGTSQKGCCPKCGAPWERIIEKNRPEDWQDEGPTTEKEQGIRAISEGIYGGNQKSRSISDIFGRATKSKISTLGWQPTCECGEAEAEPCTVLDPFAGSGTTGWVARSLGRKAILIELNPIYGDLITRRAMTDIPDLLSFDERIDEPELGDGGNVIK